MNPGDLILLQAKPRNDLAIFRKRLNYDRKCEVEIIAEWDGKKYKTVHKKERGVIYLADQKDCVSLISQRDFWDVMNHPDNWPPEKRTRAASSVVARLQVHREGE